MTTSNQQTRTFLIRDLTTLTGLIDYYKTIGSSTVQLSSTGMCLTLQATDESNNTLSEASIDLHEIEHSYINEDDDRAITLTLDCKELLKCLLMAKKDPVTLVLTASSCTLQVREEKYTLSIKEGELFHMDPDMSDPNISIYGQHFISLFKTMAPSIKPTMTVFTYGAIIDTEATDDDDVQSRALYGTNSGSALFSKDMDTTTVKALGKLKSVVPNHAYVKLYTSGEVLLLKCALGSMGVLNIYLRP
jgi:hypothetical protein